MFDEACVIRFKDEESFIEYLKCEALGYRGNHRCDSYPSENMPLHHTPGSPISYRMAGWEERKELPPGENIGIYAFCRTPEEAEEAEAFCKAESGGHHFGGIVISEDQPEKYVKFLVPVYDEDFKVERTLYHIQNNYAVEQGFVLEYYPAGIHIARTAEGKGLFDARDGIWIFPHLSEDLYTVSGEDDGYIADVQEGGKGLIRIMGDSRLRKIVAALLVPCEYDGIIQRDGEIFCVRNGKEYRYDRRTGSYTTDRIGKTIQRTFQKGSRTGGIKTLKTRTFRAEHDAAVQPEPALPVMKCSSSSALKPSERISSQRR